MRAIKMQWAYNAIIHKHGDTLFEDDTPRKKSAFVCASALVTDVTSMTRAVSILTVNKNRLIAFQSEQLAL
jgi:hypothetical protein